jgi:hypothetical protein
MVSNRFLLVFFGVLLVTSLNSRAQAALEVAPNGQVLASGKLAQALAEIILQAGAPETKFKDDPQSYYIIEQVTCAEAPEEVACQAKIGDQLVKLPDANTLHGLLGLYDGVYHCSPSGKPSFPEVCSTSAQAIACTEYKDVTDILSKYVCVLFFAAQP